MKKYIRNTLDYSIDENAIVTSKLGKIQRPRHKGSYLSVSLRLNGKVSYIRVERLMCEAFFNYNLPTVHVLGLEFKDGDKNNLALSNLILNKVVKIKGVDNYYFDPKNNKVYNEKKEVQPDMFNCFKMYAFGTLRLYDLEDIKKATSKNKTLTKYFGKDHNYDKAKKQSSLESVKSAFVCFKTACVTARFFTNHFYDRCLDAWNDNNIKAHNENVNKLQSVIDCDVMELKASDTKKVRCSLDRMY